MKARKRKLFRVLSVSRALCALLLTLPLLTACGSKERAPPPYEKNPSPREPYDLVLTVRDGPDDIQASSAYVSYKIADEACLPRIDNFEGVRYGMDEHTMKIPLQQIDRTTFKGSFFRDGVLSKDYYGKGVCKWKVELVGAFLETETTKSFTYFSVATTLQDASDTLHAKKDIKPRFDDGGIYPASIISEGGFVESVPESQRNDYFSINISVAPRKDMQ
ncbi:hypothetical protein [Stenotrophomonas cyclobalanopsidis]|uniref:hypothetical protein n=1 Tax=Stenotrophomonas cyclobalanopsidis TaxID=2771362 RepID=UPI0034611690